MAQRRKLKASELSGLWIYQDPKRGTVFYDILTNRGFSLVSKDVKTYMLYLACLPMAILLAYIFGFLFKTNTAVTIIIGIVIFVGLELAFRFFFFYKLPEVENWKRPKKDNIVVDLAKKYPRGRLFILLFFLVALTICMVVYAKMENMQGLLLYAMYALSALTAVGSLIVILAIIKQKSL